jgi:hypothetical protein
MKQVFLYWLISCSFILVSLYGLSQSANEIRRYSISSNFPAVKPDAELINYKDSTIIYCWNDFILLAIPKKTMDVKIDTDDNADTVSYTVVPTGKMNYKYFVRVKGKAKGYFLGDSLVFNSGILQKADIDSILKVKNAGDFPVSAIINKSVLVDSAIDLNSGVLKKTYALKAVKDDGDSLLLFFTDKLNDIDFSLSGDVKNEGGRKLSKIELVCIQKYSPQYNIVVPYREYSFEIRKEGSVDKKEEILNLFLVLEKNKQLFIKE